MINALMTLSIGGVVVTLQVFACTLLFSVPLAMLVAQIRISGNKAARFIVSRYIYVMRATPLLVQTMFIFFGLPFLPVIGVTLERFPAVLLAFTLNYTAYFAEIFRGGIQSVPKGQYEAAKVLGIRKISTFFKIILPQVTKIILPSVANEVITLMKDTSLVYILGMTDILKVAKSVSNTYASFFPYVFAAGLYLILIAGLSGIFQTIEQKLSYYQ